jgi:uncharacterized protein with GYD domain
VFTELPEMPVLGTSPYASRKFAAGFAQWHHAYRWKRIDEKEEVDMPTYVSLINWTDQGIRTVRETLDRADKFEELAQKHGASLEQVYWTVGPYDIVAIIEAPDDESATAVLLEGSTLGNIRTTTLRAYDRDQMSGIIQRLG